MVRAVLKSSIHGRRRDARQRDASPTALRPRNLQALPTMNEDNYGRLEPSWTVWCGRCGEWDLYSAKTVSQAKKEFKRSRWTFTRKLGWRCPNCSKNPSHGQEETTNQRDAR